MQSLKTAVKRDAERLARRVSVEFDAICHDALLTNGAAHALGESAKSDEAAHELHANAEAVVSDIPRLIRLAATRVVEEQHRNPKGWLEVVKGWQSFYESMKSGAVPEEAQQPAIAAQAYLRGIDLAIQGMPIPVDIGQPIRVDAGEEIPAAVHESWSALCGRALSMYREEVGPARYKLAESRLPQVKVQSTAEHHVKAGLLEWAKLRLSEVQPRTVKSQLDSLAVALRCVLPKLETPFLRELKGVMQPRVGDRASIPIREIQKALNTLKARPVSSKVRNGYGGGASQFDVIAVEALAFLGLRPIELMRAKTTALCTKTDIFGKQGVFFRVIVGKNNASERDIPLSDGTREIVDVSRLREMLDWQERNPRVPHGAVSSLQSRFKRITGTYTIYQMRHTWKDIAVNADVDYELRERILGHAVRGVAAVYGSGTPLREGLNAMAAVRKAIYQEAE